MRYFTKRQKVPRLKLIKRHRGGNTIYQRTPQTKETKMSQDSINEAFSKIQRPSISLFGLTFLALLILKLTGLAAISWFWVFLPLLIVPTIVLCIIMIFGFAIAIAALVERFK